MINQTENKFDNATAYERYVGRWSREIAKEFISWVDVPPEQTWLDVGAGTGILSETILQQASPTAVIGIDTSQAYIELAQARVTDSRVQFQVGDVNNLDIRDVAIDAVVAGLVINFVDSPQRAIRNMVKTVKSGGLVATYVWDYADKMEVMRHFWDAAIKVDSSARELDPGKTCTICHPDRLKTLFDSEGLNTVDVVAIDIQAIFTDFEDYWQPFVAAQGSLSKYLRSLDNETRNAIHDQLERQLPIKDDGTIPLIARAWAIKGFTA